MNRTLGEIVYIIGYEINRWLLQNQEKGKYIYTMKISVFERMWTELLKRKKGEVGPAYIQYKNWIV